MGNYNIVNHYRIVENVLGALFLLQIIKKYLMTTHAKTHNQYTLELLELFSCRKETEYERFKNVGNCMLLWHGSRMSNWAGILSQGLRIAPPEAPSTGYMVSYL